MNHPLIENLDIPDAILQFVGNRVQSSIQLTVDCGVDEQSGVQYVGLKTPRAGDRGMIGLAFIYQTPEEFTQRLAQGLCALINKLQEDEHI